ncbi:diguanylate cyclase domain-containing protein [Shewanella colwelliana]|uniref:diguanylate cyclase domain-containing protein n=1 Tax=Shewanella colwelliana TaxID=23 RepID=UPI00373642AB
MYLKSRQKQAAVFFLCSLLFLLVAVLTVSTVTHYFVENEIEKEDERLRKSLALTRVNFEASIYKDTYLADSLATVVTLDSQFAISNWEAISGKLLDKAQYVRSVALAPNNIIKYVYPLAGNEQALGFDFRTRPEQLKTVMLAKQQQAVYIAGPVNLVQGGIGLIARYPIFSDYPLNQHYWGSVSVVMDYDILLESSGITRFRGGQIAIKKHVIQSELQQVFYGDAAIFDNPDVEYPIKLPSGMWTIAAKFDTENLQRVTNIRMAVVIIGSVTAILLYLLILLLFRNYQYTHKAALQDELTHLPNRRFIISELSRLIKRNNKPKFTLLNIDLNDFKLVNDELGHEAGDDLLRYIAKQLTKEVGAKGSVARFGGDEFLVLLYEITDLEQIESIITQLKDSIASQPFHWGKHQLEPSLSIGYASYVGQNVNVKELLSDADRSMYQQKLIHREKL